MFWCSAFSLNQLRIGASLVYPLVIQRLRLPFSRTCTFIVMLLRPIPSSVLIIISLAAAQAVSFHAIASGSLLASLAVTKLAGEHIGV